MKEITMMPNGFSGSWMLTGNGVELTGCTEEETERVGRRLAKERGATFVRINPPKCIYCRDGGEMVVGGGRSGGGRMHPYITAPCTYCDAGRVKV